MDKQEKLKEAQERLVNLKTAQEKILDEIEKFKNEIEELKNEIENEKSKCWRPVTGDELHYWHIGAGYELVIYYNEDKMGHKRLYEAGELFPTKELCEERHNEKVYKERWKRLSIESGEDKNPWDGIHEHWIVYYSINTGKLSEACKVAAREGVICFPSMRHLENAINEIGEENVKRYILGIKE